MIPRLATRNWTIDAEAGTITLLIDPDTGEVREEKIEDLLTLLLWLRERESDLRYWMDICAPRPYFRPMTFVDGPGGSFYIGCCADRRLVKVNATRWNEVMEQQAQARRLAWLEDWNRRRISLDHTEVGPRREAEDCPQWVVDDHLRTIQLPEWWAARHGDNLDYGRLASLG